MLCAFAILIVVSLGAWLRGWAGQVFSYCRSVDNLPLQHILDLNVHFNHCLVFSNACLVYCTRNFQNIAIYSNLVGGVMVSVLASRFLLQFASTIKIHLSVLV